MFNKIYPLEEIWNLQISGLSGEPMTKKIYGAPIGSGIISGSGIPYSEGYNPYNGTGVPLDNYAINITDPTNGEVNSKLCFDGAGALLANSYYSGVSGDYHFQQSGFMPLNLNLVTYIKQIDLTSSSGELIHWEQRYVVCSPVLYRSIKVDTVAHL